MKKTIGKKSKTTMNLAIQKAVEHWPYIEPLLTVPATNDAYEALVSRLDELLDIVGNDEHHPLIGLVDALSNTIALYEQKIQNATTVGKSLNVLRYLMQAHSLKQKDFAKIGSQKIISEILSGKRQANLRQIKQLAKKLKVTPETFMD